MEDFSAGSTLPSAQGDAFLDVSRPRRSNTPPRSGPAPIRLLRVCLDNRVLGGVEVSEATTLADVRESIAEDEIQGVPDTYCFLFSGAPVTRRQESRRKALVCFPFGFLTIIPENARIEQPPFEEALRGSTVGSLDTTSATTPAADGAVTPAAVHASATPHGIEQPIVPQWQQMAEDPTTLALESTSEPPAAGMVEPGLTADGGETPARAGSDTLELHITDGPLEGTTVTVGEEGARVGRHTSNTLVIPEAGISRYHCEIRHLDGSFWVRDLGSVTGTFFYLKPHGHFPMFEGLMVKLGETELQVLFQDVSGDNGGEQVVLFYEGPFAGHKVYIPDSGISIGRRHDNHLVLTPDGTVSAHHAAIFKHDRRFFISDLGSSNGTCVRLSGERTDSAWHPIMDGDVLGAGCTKILCRVNHRTT
mmetsp:Transcript_114417/g.323449  ORF Transcript_114417/g.323449 Transcript_114417/m.323449 type:complete len:420 (+) Transcript_114417:51-1310(+)